MCFTPNFIDKKSVSIQRAQNSVKAESSPSGLCYLATVLQCRSRHSDQMDLTMRLEVMSLDVIPNRLHQHQKCSHLHCL